LGIWGDAIEVFFLDISGKNPPKRLELEAMIRVFATTSSTATVAVAQPAQNPASKAQSAIKRSKHQLNFCGEVYIFGDRFFLEILSPISFALLKLFSFETSNCSSIENVG
jgi:hypothetical protein